MRLGQILGQYLRKKFFFYSISKKFQIFGNEFWQWMGQKSFRKAGFSIKTLDINPPADYVCDIKNFRNTELKDKRFDCIIAFEIVEHVECLKEISELLNSGGKVFITTPVPHMDWLCKILEFIGINQKRTSPHCNLTYLNTKNIPTSLKVVDYKTFFFLANGQFYRRNRYSISGNSSLLQ